MTLEEVLNIGRGYASSKGAVFDEAAAKKYYTEEDRRLFEPGFRGVALTEIKRTMSEEGPGEHRVSTAFGQFHITNPKRFVSKPTSPPPPPPQAPKPAAPPPAAPPPSAPAVDSTREAAKAAKGKQSTLISGYTPPKRARFKSTQDVSGTAKLGIGKTTKQTLLGTA